jgi:hypothetical protein
MDMNDQLTRAWAQLQSLRSNLPDGSQVHEKYVAEYHAVLELLEEAAGQALRDFCVPAMEVRPRVISVTPRRVNYSNEAWCDRSYLVMKIDGVLNFFTFSEDPKQKRIGFAPSLE